MEKYIAEVLGTMILILLGDGVVANVVLKKTKGAGGGWIVITTGWALAVAIPVYIFGGISGAHFNPAVTVALAAVGKFPWAEVPGYIIAQLIGGFIGAFLVYVFYYNHYQVTDDKGAILGTFCTGPAINNKFFNFVSEFIGTFILLFGILGITTQEMATGVQPFAVGLLIWVIGLSLGGTTGYAINPARDFAPRLAHYIFPVPNKGDSEWQYAWIPVVAPILGGVFGALVFHLVC
ncbi:MIP/aquaporin family protein [Clostridium fallax]|uniref:Glycerol uptake facilitator protein n=1 Tax=Clostridium fallax TaxID=1533 RepID=A0A1M4SID5_9CLOT|nr:MIP/aquaporin family protein [Clostridium fallax]SHE31747.1 glycerol uptake facilitator protein [Clostridium fallax]SQB07837.1 MIP family channel protein [Clostridium fallax]